MPNDRFDTAVTESLILMAGVLANPRELTPAFVKTWVTVLRGVGMGPEDVRRAAVRIIETEKFFPTPADFIRLHNPPEDREAAEEIAWQKTLAMVRRVGNYASLSEADFGGDGLALWAIEKMGWARLCRELTEDNRAIWRAEFVRLYRAGRSTGASAEYVAGWMELENGRKSDVELTPSLVGRTDWTALPDGRKALPAGEPGDEE